MSGDDGSPQEPKHDAPGGNSSTARLHRLGDRFSELYEVIGAVGKMLIGVVALLLLVGIVDQDALPSLVRNAPFQMVFISTILIGLPLLAAVLRHHRDTFWMVIGFTTVAAICFAIFTAAWYTTAANAPLLAVRHGEDEEFVVDSSITRLQTDEFLRVRLATVASESNCQNDAEKDEVTQASTVGETDTLWATTTGGDGNGNASVQYTFTPPGEVQWLCAWARSPNRCGWRIPKVDWCFLGVNSRESRVIVKLQAAQAAMEEDPQQNPNQPAEQASEAKPTCDPKQVMDAQ